MLDKTPAASHSGLDLPASVAGLAALATNLRWTWREETRALFRDIDPELWDQNLGPVAFLRRTRRLNDIASDPAWIGRIAGENAELDLYLGSAPPTSRAPIAYFCAEYGFHESFPLYAGGLGILAGDHAKEASDLGLPFVGIGLFYRRGFFNQMVDWTGRQEHRFPTNDPLDQPVARLLNPVGEPLVVTLPFPGRRVRASVWRVAVGRVPVLLLDTDRPDNAPEDRMITSQLYTAGRDMRLCQEVVLGVGGVRVLEALGLRPGVFHLNEGHSAFLLLERLRAKVAAGQTLAQAIGEVTATSILTIHTPVPEGNERFDADAVRLHMDALLADTGIASSDLLARGLDSKATKGVFDMTAFAIRLTRLQNGVSLLHGRTADRTWRKIAGKEVIGVTNGVHMPTWLGPEVREVLEGAGASFADATRVVHEHGRWTGADVLDGPALWRAHLAQKRRLLAFAGERMFAQFARHGAGPAELRGILTAMNPDALTIGFARRFATYKRAHLMFADARRLLRMLANPDRPVQVVFAGKAHHSDRGGQALVAKVFRQVLSKRFRGRVFLLEDYDMEVGRMLVQGVDVWLNNPRRPLEASGTSGMKAAANAIPNVSILDGWWDEAFEDGRARNGWAIGGRKTLPDEAAQDKADAEALYRVLENEVIPLYFARGTDGLPSGWIEVMKRSVATGLWAFSTARMLQDYDQRMILV
ncbi:MAG: alpha-glucan family phosphorylase [Fimbriimonadaceae bacterium]|nr:alpha-glucan family phosphorylase [Fimbriimonadaceae bacterium]